MQETFLGDLIPKGEKCGSNQSTFPRRRGIFQKRRDTEWIKSTYEIGVANRGRNKRGNHSFRGRPESTLDGGKHPRKCKWFNLSIFANLCLL